MLQGIGTIEKKEQVSKWQGSVGLDRPISMTTGRVYDRERLNDLGEPEIATEKATSYSGSDDGEWLVLCCVLGQRACFLTNKEQYSADGRD